MHPINHLGHLFRIPPSISDLKLGVDSSRLNKLPQTSFSTRAAGCKIPPVRPGSTSGSPPSRLHSRSLQREEPRGRRYQKPEPPQRAPLDVQELQLYSSSLWTSEHLDNHLKKIMSATCIYTLIFVVCTQQLMAEWGK